MPLSYRLNELIGRGRPINPYLKGLLVERLRRELRPKELRLIPDELVFDGEREILERTLIYNWVKQFLGLLMITSRRTYLKTV